MDTTFLSGGGIVTTDVGGRDFGSSIVLQSDAKIIVAGESSGGGDGGFALVRYNADGSLDTTFDGDGKVRTDFGGLEYATSVALQSDGKIIVVGYNGLSSSGGGDFAVVRYNADGSFDTTFDGDGKVTTNLGGWDRAESVTVESGGKILVVGYAVSGSGGGDYALVRYNTDGSIDTTFGVGGKVITNVGAGDVAHSVIVQSDNKIVVIGDTASNFSGSSDFALVRYGADGTLDTTFGEGGKVTTNIDLVDFVGGATVQPDGRIIVVGKSYSLADMAGSGDHDFVIVRYNIDGTLDTSFNFDGKIVADFGGFDSARSVAVQADGKIVVTGSSSFAGGSGGGDVIVVRYNTNGTLDTTFSGDGIIKTAIGDESEGNGVVVQSDGKILVAGASASSGNPDFLLVRYNADGSMAPGIDFDGMPVSTASRYESFADLYVDANQQNLTGYIGSAQVELSPPGVLHCFDEDHDGFADHFTRTWADATGTHNLSGTTTWLDAMVFKSSGSELIGGVTYSVNQYGRLAYDAQGDVVGMFFLTLNPVFTMTTDTIAGDSLVATFTAYDNDDNDIKTWQLLDNNGDNVIDSVKRVGDSHSDYDIVWTDSTHFTAYRYVGMGFGSIFDNQNRPTTIPYYTSGATEQDPDVRNDIPIVWQAKGSDNVVATFFFTSSTNTVSGKLFDTNSDNIPDQISFTETDNGVSHTTMATLIGWSNLSSTNPDAVTGRVLSSNNPDDLFTGLIDGTQSAPTRIYMPSYYMGSSGVEVLSDTTSPTLISSTPADDATHVLLGSDIVLNFSEAIQGTGSIEIHTGSSTGAVVASYDLATSPDIIIAGNTLTINPAKELENSTHYFVTVSDGSIEDLAGNSYAGTMSYDFTTAPMSSGHDIGGSVSFWKTGQAISGVTTTLESSPIVPGSQLVELRNIQVAADGSRIIEIWETSSKSDIDSVQLEFTLPTGSVSAWQDATGLPSGWTTVVNTGESGQFILGGMGMTALSAGPIKLGTLTLTAPANPHHFDLSLSAGWLGEDTVPLFGISSDSMTTGPDGLYQHTGMADGTYAMTSVKVSGTAESNAIKANDALAALKMAVGMNPNSDGGAVSPYQYLAADVNQDGVIKAADALNILKMAVKLDSAPAKEWLFVPESVGSETMSRTHVVWPDSPMPVTLGADQELYLIGIVKGDVNGSWVG